MKNKLEEKVENIDVKELAEFCNENYETHFKEYIEIGNNFLEDVRRNRR